MPVRRRPQICKWNFCHLITLAFKTKTESIERKKGREGGLRKKKREKGGPCTRAFSSYVLVSITAMVTKATYSGHLPRRSCYEVN